MQTDLLNAIPGRKVPVTGTAMLMHVCFVIDLVLIRVEIDATLITFVPGRGMACDFAVLVSRAPTIVELAPAGSTGEDHDDDDDRDGSSR